MENIEQLKKKLEADLHENVLKYARETAMDRERGGFFGRIDFDGTIHPEEEKSTVMISRYLWTFSRAFRIFGRPEYRAAADHAYQFLSSHLLDSEYGGFFWSVTADGRPCQTHKHSYAQAFGLYGLSEYASLETTPGAEMSEARAAAESVYNKLSDPLYDGSYGGFFEALRRDWEFEEGLVLSDKDLPCAKTMNTNLHVIEALANYQLRFPHQKIRQLLSESVETYVDRVIDPTTDQLVLYYNADWSPYPGQIETPVLQAGGKENNPLLHPGPLSYGHDIESVWLLAEAAEIADRTASEEAGDLMKTIVPRLIRLGRAAAARGFDGTRGYLYNETSGGHTDKSSVWWVQAEAAVGFQELFKLTGEKEILESSYKVLDFIYHHHCFSGIGWHNCLNPDMTPDEAEQKSGNWKTCYHNGRMIMELLERLEE